MSSRDLAAGGALRLRSRRDRHAGPRPASRRASRRCRARSPRGRPCRDRRARPRRRRIWCARASTTAHPPASRWSPACRGSLPPPPRPGRGCRRRTRRRRRRACPAGSRATLLKAPRNLKEPVRWSISGFRKTLCTDALVEHGKGQQRGADGEGRDHARCGIDIGRADREELFGHAQMLSRPDEARGKTPPRE